MRELHNAVVFIVVVVFSTEWSSRQSGLLDRVVFSTEWSSCVSLMALVLSKTWLTWKHSLGETSPSGSLSAGFTTSGHSDRITTSGHSDRITSSGHSTRITTSEYHSAGGITSGRLQDNNIWISSRITTSGHLSARITISGFPTG